MKTMKKLQSLLIAGAVAVPTLVGAVVSNADSSTSLHQSYVTAMKHRIEANTNLSVALKYTTEKHVSELVKNASTTDNTITNYYQNVLRNANNKAANVMADAEYFISTLKADGPLTYLAVKSTMNQLKQNMPFAAYYAALKNLPHMKTDETVEMFALTFQEKIKNPAYMAKLNADFAADRTATISK